MKKPWVKNPRAPNELLLIQTLKFEIKPTRMHGEIFAIFHSGCEGPSVQALEIIRHGDVSLCRKKSRWG